MLVLLKRPEASLSGSLGCASEVTALLDALNALARSLACSLKLGIRSLMLSEL